jgi:hypothetical protein
MSTTGHNFNREKARDLARRTLIKTLPHQQRTPARHKSESLPGDKRDYLNGEVWSFGTQEYTRLTQGYCHAVTFVDHIT